MFRGLDLTGGERPSVPIRVADRAPLEVTVYVCRNIEPPNHERFRWLRDQLDRLTESGVVAASDVIELPTEAAIEQPFDGGIRFVIHERDERVAHYPVVNGRSRRSIEDGVAALRTGRGLATNREQDDDDIRQAPSILDYDTNEPLNIRIE